MSQSGVVVVRWTDREWTGPAGKGARRETGFFPLVFFFFRKMKSPVGGFEEEQVGGVPSFSTQTNWRRFEYFASSSWKLSLSLPLLLWWAPRWCGQDRQTRRNSFIYEEMIKMCCLCAWICFGRRMNWLWACKTDEIGILAIFDNPADAIMATPGCSCQSAIISVQCVQVTTSGDLFTWSHGKVVFPSSARLFSHVAKLTELMLTWNRRS